MAKRGAGSHQECQKPSDKNHVVAPWPLPGSEPMGMTSTAPRFVDGAPPTRSEQPRRSLEPLSHAPVFTRLNAASARSRCSGSSAADICTRTRAVPSGTTGKPKPVTKTPSSSSRCRERDRVRGLADDDRDDRGLAVERAGTRPRRSISRKTLVLSRRRARSSGCSSSTLRRRASALQATVGGRAFEKSCGRERCARRSQTSSRRGDVAAGGAAERLAERAGDDVDLAEEAEVLHRPASRLARARPTPCESSTITTASCSRASSTISGSFARSPSIEKTPSVTISLRACPRRRRERVAQLVHVRVRVDDLPRRAARGGSRR